MSRTPLRARLAAAAVALGLAVGGCAPTPAPPSGPQTGRATVPAPRGAVTARDNPNTPALIAQREAAGLPDCGTVEAASEPLQYGLPNVTLPCLGSTRSINLAQLRGEPLVINVWAQWCEPCRAEAPALAEFARRSAGRVRVIGIDYTDPDPAKAVEFARVAGWRYEQLVDAAGLLRTRMAIPGIPVTLLVAPDGRIVYRETGGIRSADALAAAVRQHLGVTV